MIWRPIRRVILVLCLGLTVSCGPDIQYAKRLVIENPTEFDLLVELKGAEVAGWLPLGVVKGRASSIHEDLIDMGRTWTFRFSYAGQDLGQVRSSRSDLLAAKWRFRIPDRVVETLRAERVPPSTG